MYEGIGGVEGYGVCRRVKEMLEGIGDVGG